MKRDTLKKVISAMMARQRYPWEQGVCAQALLEAGRDELWIPMAFDAVKRMDADGRLAMVGGGSAVSDPASNGEVCLRAYEKTGDESFLGGAKSMLKYLMEAAPRTSDGIICHYDESLQECFSKYQLWIDGLYMVPPFLAVMGEIDEAYRQVLGYRKHLYDDENSLFFHIRDIESGRFVRKVHWATGNGWALMGLSRVIEEAQKADRKDIYEELAAFLTELLDGMLKFIQEDGRFNDILDDERSFSDGTSSMMMAATVYRGIRNAYIKEEYKAYADKAYMTVSENIDEYGLLHQVCGCPDFVKEGTSTEAQAAFVMASAWRLRLSC